MKYFFSILFIASAFTLGCSKNEATPRVSEKFNDDWLFHLGDVVGGEKSSLSDSHWRRLDLPHDWGIEDLPGTLSPFDSTAPHGIASGFTRGGTGWYRKHFLLNGEDVARRVYIQFDGAYKNVDVWVNERHAGSHFYGYTSFWFDITEMVKFGENNLIAVRVNNENVTSRWYSGSGIYRHVWLTITEPLHIETWGTAITTPEASDRAATVAVVSTLVNNYPERKTAKIRYTIRDKDNALVAQSEITGEAGGRQKENFRHSLSVANPLLWCIETPNLYQLETEVFVSNRLVDRTFETFGIRTVEFDARHGFRLNGKTINLKGGCVHHDNGPLGALALDRAEERKVELHKAAGYNSLRMAHNPPSTALLEACDRLGILVINEAFDVWRHGHFEGDYAEYFDRLWRGDMASMILRDRNHPSIIMWSIGNEIKETQTPEVAALCGEMSRFVKSLDPSRPVTAGVHNITDEKDPFFSHLDVSGYNYARRRYVTDNQRHPDRIMYGSESFAIQAYDYWKDVENYPWVIGDFVWTSFDYIGESSIGWRGYPHEDGFFPWTLAYCGDIDICGLRRPQSFFRETLWSEQPVVSIFVAPPQPSFPLNPNKASWSVWDWYDVVHSWNFEGYESQPLEVSVYSQCSEVELFLNGNSLGKMINAPENKNIIRWRVPYQPGELKAVGINAGSPVATSVLKTAGGAAKIRLTADRNILLANGEDLSFIRVEIVDEHGVVNPVADNLVHFEIIGAGALAAVANSNPMSVESFQQSKRKAWRGECMAIVRAGKEKGIIRLAAKTDGLPEEIIIIHVE